MKKKERYIAVVNYFSEHLPEVQTELMYKNTYELLVAVILSAQCTDKRVNLVTPHLFNTYPIIESLSLADFDELFNIIRSISYPNSKARHLIGMAKMVINDFNGNIPMSVDELIKLPGVGRKTANVITSVIDHQPNMAVDTHVFRVSHRIGLTTNAKSPYDAEKQLVRHLPKNLIHLAHHWLIIHGRYTCTARNPKCVTCGLSSICKFFQENVFIKGDIQ